MRFVYVADRLEAFGVRRQRLQRGHRHLYVNDRFGAEPGNRGRAVMVDSQRHRSKRGTKADRLGRECSRPIRIIGNDFDSDLLSGHVR